MSPAQVRWSGQDVDTRSDVYSLGVVLYELLAGVKPFAAATRCDFSPDDLMRLIRDDDPPRPSHRLSMLGAETTSSVAAVRRCQARELEGVLRRELDWIVLKTIEKNRSRRYQSAGELAHEIERFLAGEPIEARPPSTAYRMAKLARRHRVALGASAFVLAGLLFGLSIATWQAYRARKAERVAAANLEAAQRNEQSLSRALYAADLRSAAKLHFQGESQQVRAILDRHRHFGAEFDDLRGFEWYFLDSLQATIATPIWRSDKSIRSLAVGPSGRLLAAGDSLGRIVVLHSNPWRPLGVWETSHGEVRAIRFIDSHRLATCGDDGELALWELKRRGADDALELEVRVELSPDPLLCLDYCQATQELFAAGDDRRIYRVAIESSAPKSSCLAFGERRIEALTATPEGGVLAGDYGGVMAYFKPSGVEPEWALDWKLKGAFKELASAGSGTYFAGQLSGRVSCLEVDAQPEIAFSQRIPADVHAVAIDSSAEWSVAGDSGGRLHLFPLSVEGRFAFLDTETARRRRTRSWQAHDAKIEQVAFLPAGRDDDAAMAVVSAARDGRLCVSRPLSHRGSYSSAELRVADFALLPRRRLIVAGEQSAFYHLEPELPKSFDALIEGGAAFAAADASGRRLFLVSGDFELFQGIPDASTHNQAHVFRPIWKPGLPERMRSFAVSSDGMMWAANLMTQLPEGRRHRCVIFRTGEPEPLAAFASTAANAIAFSPDGGFVAVVQEDNVELRASLSGAKVATLTGHRDAIKCLAFSPDSGSLASVSNDRRVICWDVRRREPRWSAVAHENRATAVAFHPTLPTLATAGEDGVVRFWRLGRANAEPASRLVAEFPLDRGEPRKIAFTRDGQSLVVSHRGAGVSVLTASTLA
ncbi:MAG: hypothetical protein AAF961_04905, partial [Planctomycetota bacterium]